MLKALFAGLAEVAGGLRLVALGAVLGLSIGLGLGWKLFRPVAAPHEASAPAARQGDGSLVLTRNADTTAAPAQVIPKGGTVERVVRVVVRPTAIARETFDVSRPPITAADTTIKAPVSVSAQDVARSSVALHLSNPKDSIRCPDVTVDLSLVRMPDKTRRVVASSPDGLVIGGVDVPLENPPAVPNPLRWAIGPSRSANGWGAVLTRDVGPFRVVGSVHEKGQFGVGVALRF